MSEADTRDILNHLRGVKGGNGQWSACCPAHDDQHGSLSVSTGKDGRILLKCHADCTADNIAEALGLSVKDLFMGSAKIRNELPQVVATYNYPGGVQKLRRSL